VKYSMMIGAVALAFTVGGCNQAGTGKDKAPGQPATQPAKSQSPVDALKDPLSYYCENGKTVVASYSTGKSGKSTVQLGIDGQVYLLTEEESGSGAKYVSDHGPRAGYRMVWWTKDDAMWLEAPVGKGADQELLIANCTLRPPSHS